MKEKMKKKYLCQTKKVLETKLYRKIWSLE